VRPVDGTGARIPSPSRTEVNGAPVSCVGPYREAVTAAPEVESKGFGHRVRAIRSRVRRNRAGALIWRVAIIIAATVVILVGIVLLVIPGPGWLVIFAGLGLLATEFDWAARLLRWVRAEVLRWTHWIAERPRWIQALFGLVGLLFLGALLAAGWWFYFLR
jgi:uncharacterized protein (TIGR02611 family)